MHMLPRVAELEERFAGALEVIGVHAGKYPAERNTRNVRAACERLGVVHPVVNDRQFRIWRDYAVDAWPTIAIVDARGYVIAQQAGELPLEALEAFIREAVGAAEAAGELRREPLGLPPDPLAPAAPSGPLRFPTRLALDGDRLFLSDMGHDRVLELRLAEDDSRAEVLRAWGGRPGFADGGPGEARFREPQGLTLVGETLYVADRRNHAVRAVSLPHGEVRTVAGTGELGGWGEHGGDALATPLRSPFDVVGRGDELVIAMAGAHQLWALDLGRGVLRVVAGTGGEAIEDGPGTTALLAQPTGLARANDTIYFADSESSAVRVLTPSEEVASIIGTGLFDHGDRDGVAAAARLQHPQALAVHDGALLVADTYNDKLKRIDPVTRESRAWDGEAGSGETLWEPSGVVSDGRGRAFVADTNAHRLLSLRADGSLREVVVG